MDGAIPDGDADEIIKIMNGKFTSREYAKAGLAAQRDDDSKEEEIETGRKRSSRQQGRGDPRPQSTPP